MIKGFPKELLSLIFPIFTVLFIALGITYFSVSVKAPRILVVPFLQENEKTIIMNALYLVSICSLSIFFFYLALKKGSIHLLEKTFAIGGGFLTIFMLIFFSMYLFKIFPTLITLLLILIFLIIGVFFIILSIVSIAINIFPKEKRDSIFMIYCSVVGSFLGMGIPIFSMPLILASLCLIDIVFVQTKVMKDIINQEEGEKIFVLLKYSDRELMIGLGDLIFYSMLVSYSLINFGALTTIFSIFLILIGFYFTFINTTKSRIFPGLPIPVGLGAIPMIISLFSSKVL